MKKLLPLLLGLALFSGADVFGNAYLYFWDTNGATGGAGGPAPTGTWGVDPSWSPDDGAGNLGVQATGAWVAGKGAVFAAGNDATGSYTVYVSGEIQAGDIHVDLGEVTFAPASGTTASMKIMDPNGAAANRVLSVGHKSADAVARYNVPITTATNLARYKRGTLIFGATNTFTGTLTVEGGVVQCAVPYSLGAVNSMALANNDPGRGDFNEDWRYTSAEFHTAGFSQRLGTLKLTGTDASIPRVLDLGNGAGTLAFADSSLEDWGAFTLTINNYALGTSKLRFGTNAGGLTRAQLARLRFTDFQNLPGQIDANGFVTPTIPVMQSIRRNGP